ncbi:polysaccharide deacetylase family protein [Candidatus Kaiserbacteria bacterium]|nr:polysaccharide deacetylase family protein [Candidatus Kaiserbacteria bacterium]
MKRIVKSFLYILLNMTSKFLPKRRAVILLYHDIGDSDLYLTVSLEQFEAQMRFLSKKRYTIISLKRLGEILSRGEVIPPKTIILTFDDGYVSHLSVVLPTLERYGFHGTFFVATDYVGKEIDNSEYKPQTVLDWNNIQILERSLSADVEPHSRSHREFPTLSEEEVEKEVNESRAELERRLKKTCATFAYPRGAYTAVSAAVVRRLGFIAGVSVTEGLVSSDSDRYTLPRNTINRDTGLLEFKGKLTHSSGLFSLIRTHV